MNKKEFSIYREGYLEGYNKGLENMDKYLTKNDTLPGRLQRETKQLVV